MLSSVIPPAPHAQTHPIIPQAPSDPSTSFTPLLSPAVIPHCLHEHTASCTDSPHHIQHRDPLLIPSCPTEPSPASLNAQASYSRYAPQGCSQSPHTAFQSHRLHHLPQLHKLYLPLSSPAPNNTSAASQPAPITPQALLLPKAPWCP